MKLLSLSRTTRFTASLIGVFALLAACNNNAPAPATTGSASAMPSTLAAIGKPSGLVVNGEAVSAELLDFYAKTRGYDLTDPNQLKLAREQLVTLIALAQQAVRDGALARPEVEMERLNLLSGVSIADGLQKLTPLDDARLQALYTEQLARIGSTEYRLRHLLFRNGSLADQAVASLNSGQNFEAVMNSFAGNPEVPEARELPWIHLGRIAPQDEALANAIRDTPVGQASKAVIITPTGWHLIEVLETRPLTPPSFETLKDSIRQAEERARRDTLIKQIRDGSKVEGLN